MASPTSPTVRRSMTGTDDDTQLGDDPSEVTRLFNERMQAWKHACGYLEDYVKSTEKMQTAHSKEYEKVLKTINSPLKEGDHFDHNPGGIASLFDKMRTNTQAISTAHTQTASSLKGTVLPIFERLHSEIKSKQKELAKGAGKGAKAVDKAKADSQKHIDLLATNTGAYGRLTAKDASNDPYVLLRGVHHRLHKQFQEENANKQDLLNVQNSFSQFESHIVQTFQHGIGLFTKTLDIQADQQKALYAEIAQTGQVINPMQEWRGFVNRNSDTLIDPDSPPKTVGTATFPNQHHESTKALCQGTLERKQGLMRKFESSTYVVTPASFLHEFKYSDDVSKDPTPELSLYIPECTIGALNGNLFSIKGKDVSKGKLGTAISTSKEYEFRAQSAGDGDTWYSVIRDLAGLKPGDAMSPTSPTGTLASREKEPQQISASPTSPQQTGIATHDAAAPASASTAAPVAATTETAGETAPAPTHALAQ